MKIREEPVVQSSTAVAEASAPNIAVAQAKPAPTPITMRPSQRAPAPANAVVRWERQIAYEWTKFYPNGDKPTLESCGDHRDPRWDEIDPMSRKNRIETEAIHGGTIVVEEIGFDASGVAVAKRIPYCGGRTAEQARSVLEAVLTGADPEAYWK